ncbi:MAG: CPBP family intramembrane glutamate endopeptidase, partial [Acidimicrobiales bacterium]
MTVGDPIAAGLPTRRQLGFEVILVLALSLGASGVYALLDLIKGLLAKAPLAQQSATLYAPADTHAWLDVTYQVVGLVLGLAPVLLVAYLLMRSGESLATIGLDASQPAEDLSWGIGLAIFVGAIGLGF